MSRWPTLDYAADRPTIETCHLVLQLIGKLPLRLIPWINHGWHVALRMVPHGYATRTISGGDGRFFVVELDVREECVRIACENGASWQAPVPGRTIAELHGDLARLLAEAGLPAPLHGAPNEMADAIPFPDDHRPRAWDKDAACRLHAAFLAADRGFTRFRSLYLGKSSPSHLFWGSFDLAVTRFSGREAPPHPGGVPNLPDSVTREAYSHEVISAGFWPGNELGNETDDAGVQEAAFYAYSYPSPEKAGGGADRARCSLLARRSGRIRPALREGGSRARSRRHAWRVPAIDLRGGRTPARLARRADDRAGELRHAARRPAHGVILRRLVFARIAFRRAGAYICGHG